MELQKRSLKEMKSLSTNTRETPKVTAISILLAIIAISGYVVSNADILGIDSNIIKWVSGAASILTFITNYVQNNFIKNN